MMQYTRYKTSGCHWQMSTNARQITVVEVELNLDPHSRHIYRKEVNVWHIQIYRLNFWESAHCDKNHPKTLVMMKLLTSHWKHEIELTCTFEDNIKNKTSEARKLYS